MAPAAESESETRPNGLFSQESTAGSCFQTSVSLQSSQLTPGWLPIGRKLELTGREPGSSILKAAPLTKPRAPVLFRIQDQDSMSCAQWGTSSLSQHSFKQSGCKAKSQPKHH